LGAWVGGVVGGWVVVVVTVEQVVASSVLITNPAPPLASHLRTQAQGQPILVKFVESILQREFSFDAPPPPASDDAGGWSSEAQVIGV